jgi:hypothetical protein
MPQLTDQQYAELMGKAQVADFIQPVWDNPKLNRHAKALLKAHYKDLQIPDYDMQVQMEQRFAAEDKRRADEEDKKKRAEEDAKWQADRKTTQDKYGFNEDQMKDLEKMMMDRNIGNYEDAAELRAVRNPKVSEPTNESRFWRHEKQDSFAEIAKDPEGWGEREIMKALKADQERERGRY